MKTLVGIAVLHIAAVCASSADHLEIGAVSRVFSPYVRQEQWGQVTAKLRNPTDRAVQARFIYFADDPTRGRIRYTRTVNLPERTRRKIRLGQRVGTVEQERLSDEKVVPNEQAIRLENAKTNKILDSKFIIVSALTPTQCCLAYVDPEDPPWQDHSFLRNIPDDPFGDVVLVSSRQKRLPDRWYGYSLLKILVISSTKPAEMRDSQIAAALDWVGRGGVLVLTAHSVADRTLADRFGEAAGVSVAGSHQEYRLEATGVEGEVHFEINLKTPAVMSHLCPTDAEVLWQANGMPLLTLRRFGAGAIFTLAVPVGVLASDQTKSLWQTIARRMVRVQPISLDAFTETAKDKLTQISGRRSRDRRTPVCIIGAQAVLFLLLGIFLHLRRRGELVWAAMIPLSLLGGTGLFIWGMTLRDEPRMSFLSLAAARTDGTAHVQQLSTYYTPKTDHIDFSSGSLLGTVRPSVSTSVSMMESVDVAGKRTMVLEGVEVIANSSRAAYAESPVDLPGRLVTKLSLGPKGLSGTITNNTGADVFDVIVITGGRAYSLGDLPAGRATEVVINDPPLPKDTYTEKTSLPSKTDRLRSDLIASVIRPPAVPQRRLSEPAPMLLGWSRRPLLNPLDETRRQRVESKGLTLLAVPLTLLNTPPGTKVVVPGGLLKLHIGGRPHVWVPKEHRFNESTLSGEVELNFAPPAGADKLTDARAVMRIAMRAPNWRMRIFGFVSGEGAKPEKTLIKTVNRPVGTYKIAIENLQRVEDQYKITIKIDPLETSKPDKSKHISTLWKIESLNLTLEGTSK